jgi:hypothetical protein
MSDTKVVPATSYHVLDLAYRLREADRREIKASSGLAPEEALTLSFMASRKSWAAVHNGRCEAIFGVAPWPLTPGLGSPWMLASEAFDQIPRATVARQTAKFVSECEREFPLLANYVDARHTKSLRWLLWAGFQVDKLDMHHGAERRPFFRFSKVSRHV